MRFQNLIFAQKPLSVQNSKIIQSRHEISLTTFQTFKFQRFSPTPTRSRSRRARLGRSNFDPAPLRRRRRGAFEQTATRKHNASLSFSDNSPAERTIFPQSANLFISLPVLSLKIKRFFHLAYLFTVLFLPPTPRNPHDRKNPVFRSDRSPRRSPPLKSPFSLKSFKKNRATGLIGSVCVAKSPNVVSRRADAPSNS